MAVRLKKEGEKFSYRDYLNWPDEERWEIINGDAYNMTPAPRTKHQSISGAISSRIGKRGYRVFYAPTDVVFDDYNVVQPDVFVVCDKNKITEKNIAGAPDLIIEIISPGTALKDKREKKKLYEKFGVVEYVIVYPDDEYVEKFSISEGKYGEIEIINWDEVLRLQTVEMEINLWEIFEKELPVKENE